MTDKLQIFILIQHARTLEDSRFLDQIESGLTMDMHSVSHNVKFSLNSVLFCKYSTSESFKDIRDNVIEEIEKQFGVSNQLARCLWNLLEVEYA